MNLDTLPINFVDMVVIGILLVSAVLAYSRGLVHELLAIGAWVGAFFTAVYLTPLARPYARDLIGMPVIADIASGVAIFVLSVAVYSILTRAIASHVKSSVLGPLDRALGFLFGLLRGAIIVCLAYIALEWAIPRAEANTNGAPPSQQGQQTDPNQAPEDPWPTWLTSAKTLPLVRGGADILKSLLPENLISSGEPGDAGIPPRSNAPDYSAQQILKDALTPKTTQSGTDTPQGYGLKDRLDLDRLIDTNR